MRPLVLLILDGWGLSPETQGNAILNTPTPNYDRLLASFPNSSLHASGEEVGLSWGEMGNSEVGHLNLGTGRVIMQDLPRINKSIADGMFFSNPDLLAAFEHAKANNSNVHILGLFSSGGVHSHYDHLFAFLEMAQKQVFGRVYLHLISDGRDTAPKVFLQDLQKLNQKIANLKIGRIASIMGRYWAMDRDKHWDRIEKAVNVLTEENSPKANDPQTAVNNSYAQNKLDEFIEPVQIEGTPRIKENDAVIFFNYRSDRAKQIAEKIIEKRKVLFVSFTNYGHEPSRMTRIAFFADKIENQLASLLSQANLSQLHLAETEKYAHVTYFFNGGLEAAFPNEERILVPSPKVETYDLQPEMSVAQIVTKFIWHFEAKKPAFSVMNFANPDMVGHTGIFDATCKAVAATDLALGKLADYCLKSEIDLIITADHGNAEQMINIQTGEVDKEHTTNPVPIIIAFKEKFKKNSFPVSQDAKIALAAQSPIGVLSDVTSTIITRFGLRLPGEMTGNDLSQFLS